MSEDKNRTKLEVIGLRVFWLFMLTLMWLFAWFGVHLYTLILMPWLPHRALVSGVLAYLFVAAIPAIAVVMVYKYECDYADRRVEYRRMLLLVTAILLLGPCIPLLGEHRTTSILDWISDHKSDKNEDPEEPEERNN